MSCKRKIINEEGKVETIIVEHHSYAWSGKMPCTGVFRCVHCGVVKEEIKER